MASEPDLVFRFTDQQINQQLKTGAGAAVSFTRHFNQAEEFFLRLDTPLTIPSFAIHHDVHNPTPTPLYLEKVRGLIQDLTHHLPPFLSDLTWFFDARDIFHLGFLQILNYQDHKYLYLLKLDLSLRPRGCTVLDPGTNDQTARFQTRDLYLEAEILPLSQLQPEDHGGRKFFLERLFEQTWRGESGRGYFVTGTWIDGEISKFLSKLVLPAGQKTYPVFPLRCRFNTLSSTVFDLSLAGRKQALVLLDGALRHLRARTREIQELLKDQPFADSLPLFQELRPILSAELTPRLARFRLEASLNEFEQKEYLYHGELD